MVTIKIYPPQSMSKNQKRLKGEVSYYKYLYKELDLYIKVLSLPLPQVSLKVAHLIAIFKRKIAGNTHRLGGSSYLQQPVYL